MKAAKFLLQAPVLLASDLPGSIRYWNEKVGFQSRNIVGEPLRIHAEGQPGPLPVRVAGFLQAVAFAPDGRAAVIAGDTSPRMIWRIRSIISS